MSAIGWGRTALFAALVAAGACGPPSEAEAPDPPAADAKPIGYTWPARLEDQPRFRLVFHAYDAGLPGER